MKHIEQIHRQAPCFVYSGAEITAACKQLKESFPEFDFLYSIKTNPFGPLVRLIAADGFGADAASAGEVKKAIACGISADNIYYSAPGKSEEDIRSTIESCTLIADSLHELEMIEQIASGQNHLQRLGIRVHPAFAVEGEAQASKFGIDLEQTET